MKKNTTPQVGKYIQQCVLVFTIIFLSGIGKPTDTFAGKISDINYSMIMPGIIPVMGTLPVVLTPLKGYYSKGKSHLYWKSLQESNSSHFEIQRSEDGIIFIQVGQVMARGNSDKEVEYTFIDIKSAVGINYYRLKLQDRDGKFQYSNIEVVNVKVEGINITGIYPEPFIDKLNVTIASDARVRTIISLYDNTGKLLISRQTDISKGITNVTIDNLSNLLKGLYSIRVQAGETMIIKRLVK